MIGQNHVALVKRAYRHDCRIAVKIEQCRAELARAGEKTAAERHQTDGEIDCLLDIERTRRPLERDGHFLGRGGNLGIEDF